MDKPHVADGPPARRLSWHDPVVRAILYQILVVGLVGMGIGYLVSNTLNNLEARNISTGFDFLGLEAGFAIGETLIDYSASDTYGRAIVAGLINTVYVSVIGIIAATVLGTIIGVARLSTNWLIGRVAGAYIEVIRNIPLLLQLFLWYALITENAPRPRDALNPLPGVFISNRGLRVPAFLGDTLDWVIAALALAIAGTLIIANWAHKRQIRTGRQFPVLRAGVLLLVALPGIALYLTDATFVLDMPELKGFSYRGGKSLSPEFAALSLGLIIYTSAFIAEVVRSGIQSVGQGQWEAANAIGLPQRRALRLVILPQALRVIIPPLTSQFLNLTKNSSLAVAIGYPDIVAVINTTLNQTGQAIEGILIVMAAYLSVSLSISLFMNWYNRRIALVER